MKETGILIWIAIFFAGGFVGWHAHRMRAWIGEKLSAVANKLKA